MSSEGNGRVSSTTPSHGGTVPIMQCPDCNGTGKLMALVDFADRAKSGAYEIECRRCLGVGAVSRKQEEWSRIGGIHRTWRIAQDESQRECAKRLGVSASDLSAMEAGRSDPSALVADTPEVLRNER